MQEFKLIVAGGRDFTDSARMWVELSTLVQESLSQYHVSIVSGMARGADRTAYDLCQLNGVTCHEFPADWDKYGKRAGYVRNEEMAKFADGLLAFWDGTSRGTQHMIRTMERLNKPVRVVTY